MEKVLLDDVIKTDYGQFDLIWSDDVGFDGDFDRFFDGQTNGLVGAADSNGLYIHFARRSGGSKVRIVLADSEPAAAPSNWEDVVEISITVPETERFAWSSWAGESGGELHGVAPGSYRVRVSARGRDAAAANEFADDVLDDYLIELWVAEPGPDAIVRATSDNAVYWHKEIGSRR
jgi:hypothetical protein